VARRWTLESSLEIFPEVRERTSQAVREVEELLQERALQPADSPARRVLDERVEQVVSRWMRAMEALGLEVKGIWLVDFDTGSGYYCWRWPEERLEYYHSYEAGFAGRARIQ